MDTNLECPICLDIYGDSLSHERSPRCLLCGDTICKKCLQDIIKYSKRDFIICPLCKEKIKKESNINNYIPNKAILLLAQSMHALIFQKKMMIVQKGKKLLNIILFY